MTRARSHNADRIPQRPRSGRGRFVATLAFAVAIAAPWPTPSAALAAEPQTGGKGGPFEPSVAEVMARQDSRQLAVGELDRLRGGFLLSPAIGLSVAMAFRAEINGNAQTFSLPSGFSGIVTGVADGAPFVRGTNQFSGLVSLVQNNLDFQQINALTTVRFDLTGSISAMRGGLLRSQLNFNSALQSW